MGRVQRKKLVWVSLASTGLILAGGLLGLVGPWPLDQRPNDELRRQAVNRAAIVGREVNTLPPPAPLKSGWASVPFRLPTGIPLAGYGDRKGAASTGSSEALAARALALEAGDSAVVIVLADLLVINRALAATVRSRVQAEAGGDGNPRIVFTATHTHSGPGAWGEMRLEEWTVAGRYDPTVFEQLATALTRAVLKAWESRTPAGITFLHTEVPALLRNRTLPGGPTDPTLEALCVQRQDSGEIGMLVVFGGHATCLGAKNMLPSRDYPGFLVDAVQQLPGVTFAGFAAGCVGSQSCLSTKQGLAKAESVGRTLAQHLAPLLETASFREEVQMRVARAELKHPPLQLRLGKNWKLSPWLTIGWSDGETAFDVIRIGEQMWITLPVELSGMLSVGLRKQAAQQGLTLTLTCFNGDYLGYLVPDNLYGRIDLYEAQMDFLGPEGERFVTEVVEAMLPRPVAPDGAETSAVFEEQVP